MGEGAMRVDRLAAGGVAVLALTLAGCGGTPQQRAPTGALAAAVNQRATQAADRHETGMNCVARAFGLDPGNAKNIGEVKTVYAWVYCHAKQDDGGEVVPAAVTLSGQPAVQIPSDASFVADIKRIFPADVRQEAYEEPKSMRDLVASLPSGPPPG